MFNLSIDCTYMIYMSYEKINMMYVGLERHEEKRSR